MESCDWSVVLPLYSAGVSWTMIYDTWYAHQDKEDDKKLGLKSTAIAWGDNTKKIASLYSVGMVGGLGMSGYAAGLGTFDIFQHWTRSHCCRIFRGKFIRLT